MGSTRLRYDTKQICSDIIIDKCNSKEMNHEVVISDMTNWIVDRFDSHNDLSNVITSKGYLKCLRRDAKYYAAITRKGSDISCGHMWIADKS